MSRKGKKDDAAELEPAQDVPDEARAVAADDAGVAGAGPAGEAEAVDAAAGDEVAPDAAAAGEVPGAVDADADAADGAHPAEDTAEDVDHVHGPADYEVDSPFPVDSRVQMRGRPDVNGVVVEVLPKEHVRVLWDDGEVSLVAYEAVQLEPAASPAGIEVDQHFTDAFAYGMTGWASNRSVLTAYAAAQSVFTPPEPEDFRMPEGLLECAAAFVRENPDVEAAVIPVQLKLKGFRPDIPVSPRELAAWTVFRAALKALDTMQATEAAEAGADARAREAGSTIAAPRDRLSFMPADAAMRPTGFTPSR